MVMLGLKETVDQLANSVHWYGHVLWRDDGHVMRILKIDGQQKSGRLKKTWKNPVEEEKDMEEPS